jgi:hypothetical protein
MTTSTDNEERYVIVRCFDTRCYSGFTRSIFPPVILERCRNLIRWNAKTWFDLAVEGPLDPGECLFSSEAKRVYLSNVLEVIECTGTAKHALITVPDPICCENVDGSNA